MGADVDLYEDPASLSYDGLVAAWHEVESRSAWFRARLAAAVPKGDLGRFAADVGVSYATVKDYRQVANAYPVEKVGTSLPFSFGVAKALMAHPRRLELVQREEPWTVAEARKLAAPQPKPGQIPGRSGAAQRDPHADLRQQLAGKGSSGKPAQDVVTGAAGQVPETVPAARQRPAESGTPDSAPCPGCRSKDEHAADLAAKLEKAHELIDKLRAAHPDKLLAAELEAVSADRDRLAARVRELEARPQIAPDGPEQPGPGNDAQTVPEAADGDPCAGCGGPGVLAWVLQHDGTKSTSYACDDCLETARRKHPEVAFSRGEPPDDPVTTQAELDEMYGSLKMDFEETA